MTAAPAAAGQPGRDDLTSRIFRALYQDFSLSTINGIYVALPGRCLQQRACASTAASR